MHVLTITYLAGLDDMLACQSLDVSRNHHLVLETSPKSPGTPIPKRPGSQSSR